MDVIFDLIWIIFWYHKRMSNHSVTICQAMSRDSSARNLSDVQLQWILHANILAATHILQVIDVKSNWTYAGRTGLVASFEVEFNRVRPIHLWNLKYVCMVEAKGESWWIQTIDVKVQSK